MGDLVNVAAPGGAPAFRDRVGRFTVRCEGRSMVVEGEFPKATVWRFDLMTFDGRRVEIDGVRVESDAEDLFAVIRKGKVIRTVRTK